MDRLNANVPRDTQAVSASPTLMIVCPPHVRMEAPVMIELPTTLACVHRDSVVTTARTISTSVHLVLVSMVLYAMTTLIRIPVPVILGIVALTAISMMTIAQTG